MSRLAPLRTKPAVPSQLTARPRLQARLAVGSSTDPLEREADRVADRVTADGARSPVAAAPLSVQALSGPSAGGASVAPVSVEQAIAGQGRPLEPSLRQDMEGRFGHDFSRVRVHLGTAAERSARDVGARAYTVGHDVVFGAAQFAPASPTGRRLLAHELAHVLQQGPSGGNRLPSQPSRQVQRQGADAGVAPNPPAAAAAPAPAPRQDYVFIMGRDAPRSGNRFYTVAEQYFRAHLPNATFVTDIRNLHDLLDYVATNVRQPIGNLYIVSHANEDGTLAFGLDSADADAHLTVRELRDALHPTGGGASALPGVAAQIDAQTTIHIKGCDLGRTREMVELLDEAFGGTGTVTAPTHEQNYATDPTLERRARSEFRGRIEADHPLPPGK